MSLRGGATWQSIEDEYVFITAQKLIRHCERSAAIP